MIFQRLKNSVGRRIVIDYTTTNGASFYAKGYLVDVSDEFVFIRAYHSEDGEPEEEWYVKLDLIENIKIEGTATDE